jgi:1-acyl-sn-glycerol-3-phosphate acyltransferase
VVIFDMIYGIVRLSLAVLVCLCVAPIALIGVLWRHVTPRSGLYVTGWIMHRWARLLCLVMGVRVRITGPKPPRPAFICPNHSTYLDIVTVGSLCEGLFVSKAEIREWPGLGHLARLGGTIFLERERRRDTHRVTGEAVRVLGLGARLLVFLEGKAGPGDRVLPFRSSLLQAPVAEGIPCVPVALYYTLPERPELDTTDIVAWHSHLPLHHHMWRLACSGRIDVEVRILPARSGEDRKVLAKALEEDVRGALDSMIPSRT